MDVVVTVPKNFTHPASPGLKGLAAWLAEGDPPGAAWSGQDWRFTTWGTVPKINVGERVYVVCEGRLVGYSPLHQLQIAPDDFRDGKGPIAFVRRGGAVAVTIDEPITGFRGWRYRWWNVRDERPLELAAKGD